MLPCRSKKKKKRKMSWHPKWFDEMAIWLKK